MPSLRSMASDPMTPPEVVVEKARRACEKCTRTKKKCDKALPKCERCSRLATACCYNFIYAPPTLAATDASFFQLLHQQQQRHEQQQQQQQQRKRQQQQQHQQQQPGEGSPSMAYGQIHSLARSTTSSSSSSMLLMRPPVSGSEHSFESEVSAASIIALIGSRGISWRDAVDLYFDRVHHWMSVVHQDTLWSQLDHLGPTDEPGDVETALLVVCMYLVSRPADDAAEEANQPHLPGYAAAAAAAEAAAASAAAAAASAAGATTATTAPAPTATAAATGSIDGAGGGYAVPGTGHCNSPPASWPSYTPQSKVGVPLGHPRVPDAIGTSGDMLASPIYLSAKRLLVLLRAFSTPSIGLVQCGTLIALYELGHGDPWRAYVTFGETLAMSKLIGVSPGMWDDDTPEDEPVHLEEDQVCSLYWALFVLDKLLHFGFAFLTCPIQMQLPAPEALLPAQNYLWSVKEGRRVMFWRRVISRSAPDQQRLGPFQRAVQAAILAHRAIMWEGQVQASMTQRTPSMGAETYVDLDDQARSLIEVIVFQDEPFAENCEALGMCFGVMLMLHTSVLGGGGGVGGGGGGGSRQLHENDRPRAMAGINFVIRMVGDSSADANFRMSSRPDLSNIFSPATGYAAYHALKALTTLDGVIENAQSRFHDIYCCMFFLARRWALAGRLLALIETLLNKDSDEENHSTPGMQSDGDGSFNGARLTSPDY